MILTTGANCMDIMAVKIVLWLFLFFLGLNTWIRLIRDIDKSKANPTVVYAVSILLVSFIYLCLYYVLIWAMIVVNNML